MTSPSLVQGERETGRALTDEEITRIAETLPDPKFGGFMSWGSYGYRQDENGEFSIANVPTYVVLPFARALLARASSSTVQQVGTPEGFALVPIVPTPEMITAGADELYVTSGGDFAAVEEEIADVYKRMVASSPKSDGGMGS